MDNRPSFIDNVQEVMILKHSVCDEYNDALVIAFFLLENLNFMWAHSINCEI